MPSNILPIQCRENPPRNDYYKFLPHCQSILDVCKLVIAHLKYHTLFLLSILDFPTGIGTPLKKRLAILFS